MLLPRYRTEEPERRRNLNDKLRQITRRDSEIRADLETPASTDPADSQLLRGIPCIAQGVGGTSPGTAPHLAILRNDRTPRYILRNR